MNKRGRKPYGSNNGIGEAIAYIHGRIEREIESICISSGIPFGVIAERISQLLHPGRQWSEDQMPLLRSNTPRLGTTVATLEMVEHSHNDASPPAISGKVSNNRRKAIGGSKGAINSWANLTSEERSKEMKRRRMVALGKAKPRDKDKFRAAKQAAKRAKQKPAYTKSGGRSDLQKIYQERYTIKKWNQQHPEDQKPLPQLPVINNNAA